MTRWLSSGPFFMPGRPLVSQFERKGREKREIILLSIIMRSTKSSGWKTTFSTNGVQAAVSLGIHVCPGELQVLSVC